ncbi:MULTISPECIES: M20 family metallo-hydrolase [Sutcliffiella]|uniref:Zn-dependent hydrolase n=1 Tax=Sutcliffiella cohnii TaxID=33932 RepID=A0A223KVV9_9BACI|nr:MULTISPECIES: M20 family metallo-hydrolase [Sutcliffiella]AST93503.1 Zn-dependent hydrolase [Sutcliffiella cohnii]WBL14687.1 M20 family metallo-hydrolase [Sutcliffiella sp. NC1]
MKQWLDATLKQLNLVETMEQPTGFTRLGYTEEENESLQAFITIAKELGLYIIEDAAGNVIARWETNNGVEEKVAIGSHVDTVTNGGGYDGTAGVLVSLGAIKLLKEEGFTPTHPIDVIVFRSEESSRFGISTVGSKAISGILDPSIGSVTDADGISIKEAVEALGYQWEDFSQAKRTDIKSFVELHIEQGTVIEDAGKQYGVVRGVACPIRLKVKVQGKAGHTGTTPMNKRQDALLAASHLIPFVSETAIKLNATSELPVVATVSTIECKPNAMNVIPGVVELGIDIRSVDDSLKSKVADEIRNKCLTIEKELNCSIEIDVLVHNPSILLDESIQKKLLQAGDHLGYTNLLMDSGAGHDVMNMQQLCPSGLIFIPCRDGLSHHPKEYASIEDLYIGVEIVAQFLRIETGERDEHSRRSSRS